MKKLKKNRESLKATPTFSGRNVSNPMEASRPPVPATTSAVTKSSASSFRICSLNFYMLILNKQMPP